MFPARAGVILSLLTILNGLKSVPRASGGDPNSDTVSIVFPARAGVQLNWDTIIVAVLCVPRASGGTVLHGKKTRQAGGSVSQPAGTQKNIGIRLTEPGIISMQEDIW